jgi:hypothetical protein
MKFGNSFTNVVISLWDMPGGSSPLFTTTVNTVTGWTFVNCGTITLQANREYVISYYHPTTTVTLQASAEIGNVWVSSTVSGVTFQYEGGNDNSVGNTKPTNPSHSSGSTWTPAVGVTFTPNTAPNAPTGLGVSTTDGTPRLSWTFTDPDAGNTQSAREVEVWNSAGTVLVHGSGKLASANAYYDMPSGILAASTTYKFRVRVWDQADAVSAYSAYQSWTTAQPYAASGTFTMTPIDIDQGATTNHMNNGTFMWTGTKPTSTNVTIEYQTSANGTTYGSWSAATALAPGITMSIPPCKRIRFRFNLSTSYNLSAPAIESVVVTYPQEYAFVGSWTSPVIDTSTLGIVESYGGSMTLNKTLNGGLVYTSYRTSPDNFTWSGWTDTAGPLGWARYVQFKVDMYPSADFTGTPNVDTFVYTFNQSYENSGEWVSAPISLKHFEPASGTVAQVSTLNGGTVQLYTRYRNDPGAPWSAWALTSGAVAMTGLEMQTKVVLTRNTLGNQSPSVDSTTTTYTANRKRGVWTSESIDVSQATDKTTGKVSSDLVLNGDAVQTQFQYSTNGGSIWSLWTDPLSDGTMTAPSNTTHIRVRHIVTGPNAEIRSTTVYFDGLPTVTVLGNSFQPNAVYDFTQLREIVMICNGKDNPQKWDGTNPMTTLGGGPPAFQMMETHLNRAWGAGDPANPSRIRFSDILNPESWPALNFIDFNPEDGDRITALYRYGQQLIVSKQKSMALLTGDRSANFAVVWLDHPQGVEGFQGIQTADKYLAYIARDGIRFSDLTKSILATEKLKPSWELLNHRRLSQATMISTGNYLLCALPSAGSLVNDQVWFFDILRAAWSIIPNWNISSWLKFRQYGEEVLLAGDSTKGQIYEVFTGTTDANGAYMTYDFQTKDFDADYPERYKVLRDCVLIVGGVTEESVLTVTFVVDGVEYPVDTADTTIPAGAGAIHSIRLIPPVYGAVLGQQVSIRLHGRNHIHALALGVIIRGVVPGVS